MTCNSDNKREHWTTLLRDVAESVKRGSLTAEQGDDIVEGIASLLDVETKKELAELYQRQVSMR